MDARTTARRSHLARSAAAIMLLSGIALTTAACQSEEALFRPGPVPVQQDGRVLSSQVGQEFASTNASADQLERAILAELERRRLLSERFAGMPADRIERELVSIGPVAE